MRRLLVAIAVGMSVYPAAVLAKVESEQDIAVFGPTIFERSADPPSNFTAAFGVPSDVHGPMRTSLHKKAGASTSRVLSARILLNRPLICGPSEFTQDLGTLEHWVSSGQPNHAHSRRYSCTPGILLQQFVDQWSLVDARL